jgi:uncharacterized protein YdeI (BOF family)
MGKIETIQDLFDTEEDERSNHQVQIRGQVMSDIDNDKEFQFHDVSEAIWVAIDNPKLMESKHLANGKYVKLINPQLQIDNDRNNKKLVLTTNSQIIPTPKLKTLADFGFRPEEAKEDPTFENIKKLSPNDVSIFLYLKKQFS